MSFDGKTALVTGSSRGIGRGIALALAERGVKVAVHYHRNEEACAKVADVGCGHGVSTVIVAE